MHYTVSFAVILYALSAVIDAVQGITELKVYESYAFRIASAVAVIAIYVHVMSNGARLKTLPFVLASLIISTIVLAYGRLEPAALLNMAVKAAAIILTWKPDLIELEIITEDEEESQKNSKST